MAGFACALCSCFCSFNGSVCVCVRSLQSASLCNVFALSQAHIHFSITQPICMRRTQRARLLKERRAVYTRMISELYDMPDAKRSEGDKAALRQVCNVGSFVQYRFSQSTSFFLLQTPFNNYLHLSSYMPSHLSFILMISSHNTLSYFLSNSQVIVDVPRTAPHVPFFHFASVQKSLERLLYIWGIR